MWDTTTFAWFLNSVTHSLTHPPTHPLTHSLTHPPTHSLTHPPSSTHPPTHSLTHLVPDPRHVLPLTHLVFSRTRRSWGRVSCRAASR